MPLYELVERLYTIFDLKRLEGQSAYVCSFFDRLSDFLKEYQTLPMGIRSRTSLIALFIKEWDETISSKTIQSDEIDGIRIISIHKSKGLEFDHVVIPFCDWQLEKQGNIIWCQPSEPPFDELPLAPIDYSTKQLVGTIYEPAYQHEHLQNTVDNLNLLYVAFTRASRSLTVLGRRGSPTSRSTIIEQVLPMLQDILPGSTIEGLEADNAPLLFCHGDLSGLSTPIRGEKERTQDDNPFLTLPTPLPIPINSFPRLMEFRQSNRSKDFLEDSNDEKGLSYINIGSILHEVFSTIRTTDDIDSALERLQLEGILYDEHNTSERIISILRKRLENPKVAEWFSGKYKLYNECTILKKENGQLKERRPDRVMTDGNQWIVVDFKFGVARPEYESQVREYMTLIKEMHPDSTVKVQGFLWFVYSNKIVEIQSAS